MAMEKNKKKQVIIASVYAVLILLFLGFIISRFMPAATCSDGVKNQNEEGIDCGGVCVNKCVTSKSSDLVVAETGFVESGIVNKYDLYAQVVNPNDAEGSGDFQYDFVVKDMTGNIVGQKSGSGFILPSENKYLIAVNVEVKGIPAKVEFKISDTQWTEFKGYEKPVLRIVNKNYNEVSSDIGFAEVKGLLRNESPFDFGVIKIDALLRDAGGKIIALNSTQMNTVKSGENREFTAAWPNRFPGSVSNFDVQIEVNVFDSEVFLKRYFGSQQF
jgi:hypothetical protein